MSGRQPRIAKPSEKGLVYKNAVQLKQIKETQKARHNNDMRGLDELMKGMKFGGRRKRKTRRHSRK